MANFIVVDMDLHKRIFRITGAATVRDPACLFVCLERALAQFPLCWCQVNGVHKSYRNYLEAKGGTGSLESGLPDWGSGRNLGKGM